MSPRTPCPPCVTSLSNWLSPWALNHFGPHPHCQTIGLDPALLPGSLVSSQTDAPLLGWGLRLPSLSNPVPLRDGIWEWGTGPSALYLVGVFRNWLSALNKPIPRQRHLLWNYINVSRESLQAHLRFAYQNYLLTHITPLFQKTWQFLFAQLAATLTCVS